MTMLSVEINDLLYAFTFPTSNCMALCMAIDYNYTVHIRNYKYSYSNISLVNIRNHTVFSKCITFTLSYNCMKYFCEVPRILLL